MPSKSILALSLLLVTLVIVVFSTLNHFNKFNIFVRAGNESVVVTKSPTYDTKVIANPTTLAKISTYYRDKVTPIQSNQLKALSSYNQEQKQQVQAALEKAAKEEADKLAAEKAKLEAEQKAKQEAEAKVQAELQKARELKLAQQIAEKQANELKQIKDSLSTDNNMTELRQYAQDKVCLYFGCENWSAFDFVISKESRWNPLAVNPSSGACGLGQALPCSKMASYGADYTTNGKVQIDWTIDYIKGRYSTPNKAKVFWVNNNWY